MILTILMQKMRHCTMDLNTALDDSKIAIHFFFNNKFDDAQNILQPWVGTSLYHTMGTSIFQFLEAILTFQPSSIQKASTSLKRSIRLCNLYRKKNTLTQSIGNMMKKPNYDSYTPDEIHAELCYAEALLLKALLTFIEDETLVSFLRAGIKIRSCFNSYKECNNILVSRSWIEEENSYKVHFESGVRLGIGAFNLMISLLPSKIIKLLEFIGFSGSKHLGLNELHLGNQLQNGVRHVLCVMTLLAYNLVIVYVFTQEDGDLEFCDVALKQQLAIYPNGALFLYFKGRLEFMRGNTEEAAKWYTSSVQSQIAWKQFHHICYWEMVWAYSVALDWKRAEMYACKLMEESKWSRTIYNYQRACIMLMRGHSNLSRDDLNTINQLMLDVPKYKQRIAGKSIPMEKFSVKKSQRYINQNNRLFLPAVELMYLWNLFKVFSKKKSLCENLFRLIDKHTKDLEKNPGQYGSEYEFDNKALGQLLKGTCLRIMNTPLLAEECLKNVISLEKKIKEDRFLVPYAHVELAFLYKNKGQLDKAAWFLESAKKNYSGYSLETRLHFQIHCAWSTLNESKPEGNLKANETECDRY
ncbi:tetratricopeptide repeat protein 39B-like isoform X2 [Daktulosphaira vitifoliae]|uniref:tetratricopeptide repeat protein 39B-like isoform X2 n=1 Tax=Daktulosphaira vitifoliae TaxID=58002 RepID=UPI0021AACD79|nr:tetratricopeptide repeat protein 39B-like isoform X2 [Daktulosphaira vitifoliae]